MTNLKRSPFDQTFFLICQRSRARVKNSMQAWGDPTIVKETLSLDKKSVLHLFVEKILHSLLHNLLKIAIFPIFLFQNSRVNETQWGKREKLTI